MRALFLTPQVPHPPRQGTQIRNYHLIRTAAGSHTVDLLSFARPGESLETAGPLRDLCRTVRLVPAPRRTSTERIRLLLTSPDPDMGHRLRSEGLVATLCEMLRNERYDLVQIEGIEMARYAATVREASPGTRIVFDDHNAEYVLQGRAALVDAGRLSAWPKAVYSALQWWKLRRFEAWACATADAVLAVSEDDAAALRRLGVRSVEVVPNGVDTESFRPDSSAGREPAMLLFTGTMDFRPNVDAVRWFVAEVLPEIASLRPEVRLEIVGRSPSPAVVALASRQPAVVVTGPVDDVKPYFARATVFVVPMRMGGGVRLKILEALAAGVPAVSTAMGAEGTGLAHDRELLIAGSAEGFANSVLRLLEDADLRGRLAAAGREAVVRRFDWARIGPRLLDAYERLVPSHLGERKRNDGVG